jgi:hypothetical protein
MSRLTTDFYKHLLPGETPVSVAFDRRRRTPAVDLPSSVWPNLLDMHSSGSTTNGD